MAPQAEQHALEDLPVEVLIYLLGSRYCEPIAFPIGRGPSSDRFRGVSRW
jgi:hypothetical protein